MIQIEPSIGSLFSNVCVNAKKEACEKRDTVFFIFNGRKVFINPGTDLDKVYKEYEDAHLMGWDEIYGRRIYDAQLMGEIESKKQEHEIKERIQREEYEKKDRIQREEVLSLVSGIEMEITDVEAWQKGRDANKDGYGNACFEYASDLAKLIQIQLSKGVRFEDCISECESKLGFHGISGFQHGAVISILSQCWKHGESIKDYYAKLYK